MSWGRSLEHEYKESLEVNCWDNSARGNICSQDGTATFCMGSRTAENWTATRQHNLLKKFGERGGGDGEQTMKNEQEILATAPVAISNRRYSSDQQLLATSDHPWSLRSREKGAARSFLDKRIKLYKTEICRTFEETGACRYGAKCQFAHCKEELRSTARHPRYKTEICKTFWEHGTCPYGKRCCFIHNESLSASNSSLTMTSFGEQEASVADQLKRTDYGTGDGEHPAQESRILSRLEKPHSLAIFGFNRTAVEGEMACRAESSINFMQENPSSIPEGKLDRVFGLPDEKEKEEEEELFRVDKDTPHFAIDVLRMMDE